MHSPVVGLQPTKMHGALPCFLPSGHQCLQYGSQAAESQGGGVDPGRGCASTGVKTMTRLVASANVDIRTNMTFRARFMTHLPWREHTAGSLPGPDSFGVSGCRRRVQVRRFG